MSGMGETLADFIKGLYWVVGILSGIVGLLVVLVVYLLVTR